VAKRYPHARSAILPALHIVHHEEGWVSREACDVVADLLELPRMWLYDALTFYTYFPQKPVGKYHIQFCHNIACNLRGAEDMIEYLKSEHGIKEGDITDDGLFTLNRVECLGACGNAPMMQVNDDFYEDLTLEELGKLIDGWKKSAGNGSH
ncbi:NAD(P)H-dependent oxidoreductase subunit E, partial [bacterium]|nr:NAD(P)H-dependent oxidoreductase subunit E [bacterium]